jgi:hypothetical protein
LGIILVNVFPIWPFNRSSIAKRRKILFLADDKARMDRLKVILEISPRSAADSPPAGLVLGLVARQDRFAVFCPGRAMLLLVVFVVPTIIEAEKVTIKRCKS